MTGLADFVDAESADSGSATSSGTLDSVESPTERLHLMQIEYEEQFGDVIVHIWARTQDGERRHVEVEGHHPSFYIREEDYDKRIRNHDWVETVENTDITTIHGEPLVRVVARLPKHVGGGRDIDKGLREYFEETWEADVFFTSRFLIDTGIHTHFEVDLDETWTSQHHDGDYRVHVDDISPVEDPDWRATPRTITADIEVLSPDGFPEASEASHPVTAITAYDNYDEAYQVWVLRYEGWGYSDTEVSNIAIENRPDAIEVDGEGYPAHVEEVHVYEEESAMLHDFNEYVAEREPDLLSGWNSSTTMNGDGFDYPYLVNRCKFKNVSNYRDWSPMGQVWTTRRGREQNLTMGGKGVAFFDMMEAYKKTQYNEPKGGWGLSNTSKRELGMAEGKLDIEDIDEAWRFDLGTFLEYNIRDVQAVVAIDAAAGATSMYQDIRRIGGVQFESCHNAIDTLDVFIIRMAREYGYALPTSEKPERDWYYGAYVFEPKLGRHENVVYPDLWSMYPNMIRNCNMSPETMVGTQEDLDASEYTEDDCRWTYIDTRRTAVKKESAPQYEQVYFVKPSVQKGFMNEVIGDLMDMKDAYKGESLYGPLKHNFINAVYGVFGDSDTYNKGYRLFDWRIAEGITLGGRKMIQDSSERFVDAVNELKDEYGYGGNNAYRVGGDTDSVMTSIPFVDVDYSRDFTIEFTQPDGSTIEVPDYYQDFDDIVHIAHEAADRVNEWYDGWTAETFNLTDGPHYCELEIESFAPRAFVPEGVTKKKAKKRYCEIIAWDEGTWQYPPEFEVTGIDIVRSDRAPVTRDILEDVLDTILRVDDREEARRRVYDRIKAEVEAIEGGERENEWIARPKGMTKHPSQYGTPSKKASATYRGARYANENFDWENLTAGDKPALLYIDKVRGNWPTTYSNDWEVKGAATEVDAISGNEPNKIPDEFVIDTDKQLEKVLEDPLTPILAPMRWSYDEALSDTEQGDLAAFM